MATRFLQITDCHILSEVGEEIYGADTYQSLRLVLEAAFSLDQAPEFVLATGDLSEDGSAGSYERLRELLLTFDAPVFVIPGNHDSRSRMKQILVGGPISMVPHVDVGTWRIIFLDSTVEGQPFGHLRNAELERLEQTLVEEPERPAIVCLHHSPIRPCPSTDCHLKNEQELLDVLDSHPNAKAVLAGHSHDQLERRCGEAMLLTTPATSSQCVHAQAGEPVDHEDFWASHRFDPSRRGFRVITTHPDDILHTQVHWLQAARNVVGER